MTCFSNFVGPLRRIFIGNLLFLICSLFYLAWWLISFRPNPPGGLANGLISIFFITAAFITAVVAIVWMSGGINTLSQDLKSIRVGLILLGGAVLMLVVLLVTTFVFHRTATLELALIHGWAVLELSAVAVLYGTGHFGPGRAVILTLLVGIATIVGLFCYVLYYRLDKTASYWIGMIPLIMDAFVMAVFLGVLAVRDIHR
jgi:hypothetical protein